MQKVLGLGLVLASASLLAAQAQYPDMGAPPAQNAPIAGGPMDRAYRGVPRSFEVDPAPGVTVRSDLRNGTRTQSSAGGATEIHVLKGRADVIVRHPEDGSEILVDLPGGQVALIKDGFYTFNADTDTVRVLNGEAVAYTGAADTSRGTKVKETQQLVFGAARLKAVDADRRELSADLVAGDEPGGDEGYGARGGYGFYGGGYPYFGGGGFGYPFAYGFAPYGYGYPFGLGLGFGYYGGFGGYYGGFGGFRRGGFRR